MPDRTEGDVIEPDPDHKSSDGLTPTQSQLVRRVWIVSTCDVISLGYVRCEMRYVVCRMMAMAMLTESGVRDAQTSYDIADFTSPAPSPQRLTPYSLCGTLLYSGRTDSSTFLHDHDHDPQP